jgi:uncharacterized protein (TIGR00369 family)
LIEPVAFVMSGVHFGDYLGLERPVFEGEYTVIALDIKDHHLNVLGVVHGGVITTLSDTTMGTASFVQARRPLVTVELKISFMRPAFKGRLTAKAKVLKKGEHLVFAACSVFDEEGKEVAVALGTYMIIDQIKR